jgi:inhibitor of KinA sporulation pathway (predicted exonuclease)
MSIYKDKIVIVDFEATCWPGYDAPPGQENEIIEMGVCLLKPGEAPGKKHSILVQPTESVVSAFCEDLTGISQQMVDTEGITFEKACKRLEHDFNSRNRMWASWGGWDRRIIRQQCKRRGVRYPFSKKFANLKRVFQDAYGKRLHLAGALEAAGIEAKGQAHRGGDDAYNTARLLAWLIDHHGEQILKRYGW